MEHLIKHGTYNQALNIQSNMEHIVKHGRYNWTLIAVITTLIYSNRNHRNGASTVSGIAIMAVKIMTCNIINEGH